MVKQNGNKAFNEMLHKIQKQYEEGNLTAEAINEFLIFGIIEINKRLSSIDTEINAKLSNIESNQKAKDEDIENKIDVLDTKVEKANDFRMKFPPIGWLLKYRLKSMLAYILGVFVLLLGFTMQPTRSFVVDALFGMPDIPGDWAVSIFPTGIILIIIGRLINISEKKFPEDTD